MSILQGLIASLSSASGGGGGGVLPQPAGLYAWEWDSDSASGSNVYNNTSYYGNGANYTSNQSVPLTLNNGFNTGAITWPSGTNGYQVWANNPSAFMQTPDFLTSGYTGAWASNSRTGLTIELWFYPTAGARTLVSEQGAGGAGSAGWRDNIIELNSNGTVVADIWPYTGGPITTANAVNFNAWNHVIYTYNISAGLLSIQLNGGTVVSATKDWQCAVEFGGGLYYALGFADATNLMANANTNNFDGYWGKVRIANYPMASNRSSDWAKYNSFSVTDSGTSLGASWTVEVVGDFYPSNFWATMWGNEAWNPGTGHIAYLTGPTSLNVGRPNAEVQYSLANEVSVKSYWAFTHNGGGTATYTNGSQYSHWSFNNNNGLMEIFNPSGSLLSALQAGIPSGTVLTIPASGADPEYVFTLTSGITYDMFAGGGSGAWTATWTLTSNNSWGAGSITATNTINVTTPAGGIDVYRNGTLLTPSSSNYSQPSSAGNTLIFGARHLNDGSGGTGQDVLDKLPGNYLYTNITASALSPATIASNYTALQATYGLS